MLTSSVATRFQKGVHILELLRALVFSLVAFHPNAHAAPAVSFHPGLSFHPGKAAPTFFHHGTYGTPNVFGRTM